MSLLTPAQIKELCHKYNLSPSKNYGQNYLVNDAPIRKMIEAGELSQDDTVVEIGPGFGVLTLAMAPLVKKVIAFEIEKTLQPYWQEKQKEFPNIEVVWGNALKALISYLLSPITPYKVLANLPYQITSDVLRTIFELDPKPERIIVMVQKEVAERICAKPGDMSLLSVAVQYYGTPRIVTHVSRGNFWPSPKVDSAVIEINTKTQKQLNTKTREHINGGNFPLLGHRLERDPAVAGKACLPAGRVGRGFVVSSQPNGVVDRDNQETFFFKVARAGFAHKRKQLWRNLAEGLGLAADSVKQILHDVTGNDKIRAEELSIEEWVAVTEKISAQGGSALGGENNHRRSGIPLRREK